DGITFTTRDVVAKSPSGCAAKISCSCADTVGLVTIFVCAARTIRISSAPLLIMNRCFPLSGLLVACLLAATSVIFYAAGSLTAANERWMATSAANHWVVGKG